MGESCDKILLALHDGAHLVDLSFNSSSHPVKTAAQCADLIVGLYLCAPGVFAVGDLLAGCAQFRQGARHPAAEQHCRRTAQSQQQHRGRQPGVQLLVPRCKHSGDIIAAQNICLYTGNVQRLRQQQIPTSVRLSQLPAFDAACHRLYLHIARQGRRQGRVQRILSVQPKGQSAVFVGGLLRILLGR